MSFIAVDEDHNLDPDYPVELDGAGRDLDPTAPIWQEFDWVFDEDDDGNLHQEPHIEAIGPSGMTVAQILEEWASAKYSPGWSPG